MLGRIIPVSGINKVETLRYLKQSEKQTGGTNNKHIMQQTGPD